jgi:transcription initiation factor TFIIE subunit alpha
VHDPDNNRGGHEQSTRYHAQFRFITDLLPKIDEVVIPENTFEKALVSARKVIRDETNPANDTAPVDSSASKPTAVRGMVNVGPSSINVTITKSEGPTEADIATEQARKEKIAAQKCNASAFHTQHN